MKPIHICAGPPAGTITQTEADAMGKPKAAGLPKRGVMRRGHLVPCGASLDKVISLAKAKAEKKAQAAPGDELEATYTCPKCGRDDGRAVWAVAAPKVSAEPEAVT